MVCFKCGSKCLVAETREYIPPGESQLSEIRVYVCTNYDCLTSFTYRNTFLNENKRRDVKKHLDAYERMKQKQLENQTDLFDE